MEAHPGREPGGLLSGRSCGLAPHLCRPSWTGGELGCLLVIPMHPCLLGPEQVERHTPTTRLVSHYWVWKGGKSKEGYIFFKLNITFSYFCHKYSEKYFLKQGRLKMSAGWLVHI